MTDALLILAIALFVLALWQLTRKPKLVAKPSDAARTLGHLGGTATASKHRRIIDAKARQLAGEIGREWTGRGA